MIGIIPAAGNGKRLNMGCKALVKVNGRRLIEYPLENMMDLEINKVIIIENETDISSVLGKRWNNINLEYVTQKEKKGIAHAISLTEDLVDDDFIIILGDIVYSGFLDEMKHNFEYLTTDLLVAMKPVKDKKEIKKSFGVRKNKFVEKPKTIRGLEPFLGLGVYMANKKLFDAIRKTKVSKLRNEIELTDALNHVENSKVHFLTEKYINVNNEIELEEVKR